MNESYEESIFDYSTIFRQVSNEQIINGTTLRRTVSCFAIGYGHWDIWLTHRIYEWRGFFEYKCPMGKMCRIRNEKNIKSSFCFSCDIRMTGKAGKIIWKRNLLKGESNKCP